MGNNMEKKQQTPQVKGDNIKKKTLKREKES